MMNSSGSSHVRCLDPVVWRYYIIVQHITGIKLLTQSLFLIATQISFIIKIYIVQFKQVIKLLPYHFQDGRLYLRPSILPQGLLVHVSRHSQRITFSPSLLEVYGRHSSQITTISSCGASEQDLLKWQSGQIR